MTHNLIDQFSFGLGCILLLWNCQHQPPHLETTIATVTAVTETQEAQARQNEDAADDPAIFVHPYDSTKHWIIGTNKKAGLSVYNLKGEEVFFTNEGNPNNVDLRMIHSVVDSQLLAIVGCSERTKNQIWMYQLNIHTGALNILQGGMVNTPLPEIYGFCMFHDLQHDALYAIANDKNGTILQYAMSIDSNLVLSTKLVAERKVDTQPEGMVADDELGYVFVGEENQGIWRFQANPQMDSIPAFIAQSGRQNKQIQFDIEGLTICKFPNFQGYLMASSQGNNTYAIFDRQPPHQYRASFKVVDSEFIDGTEDTDGICVTTKNLGPAFPHGLFVTQDGFNRLNGQLRPQNFKYVDLKQILDACHLGFR